MKSKQDVNHLTMDTGAQQLLAKARAEVTEGARLYFMNFSKLRRKKNE